jgi:hypothetical protein
MLNKKSYGCYSVKNRLDVKSGWSSTDDDPVEYDQYDECRYDPNSHEAEGFWVLLPRDQASYFNFLFLLSEI